MNTEITVKKAEEAGVVFYDDACVFCSKWAHRFRPALNRVGLSLAPLGANRTEMRIHFADGRTLGGADAVVALSRRIWWLLPLWLLSRIPGILPVLRICYRFIARHRHCLGNTCEIPRRTRWLNWNRKISWLKLKTLFAFGKCRKDSNTETAKQKTKRRPHRPRAFLELP